MSDDIISHIRCINGLNPLNISSIMICVVNSLKNTADKARSTANKNVRLILGLCFFSFCINFLNIFTKNFQKKKEKSSNKIVWVKKKMCKKHQFAWRFGCLWQVGSLSWHFFLPHPKTCSQYWKYFSPINYHEDLCLDSINAVSLR